MHCQIFILSLIYRASSGRNTLYPLNDIPSFFNFWLVNKPCKIQKNCRLITQLYISIINRMLEQHQQSSSATPLQSPQKQTLATLIDSIDFVKKNKTKSSTMSISDGDSLSSGHDAENKEKSKVWTAEEVELFNILLRKYGTDFHILSNFFPRKTKSQLKNRYKLYISGERKREKEEVLKLKAVSQLFKEVQEREQRQEREDMSEGRKKSEEGYGM